MIKKSDSKYKRDGTYRIVAKGTKSYFMLSSLMLYTRGI